MNSDFQTLQVANDGGIVVCHFSRPQARNALNAEMVAELRLFLQHTAHRNDVDAIVFAGNDKAFVSGADITELRQRDRFAALQRINTALFREIETLPHPTIAAIRGYALGGGLELALACDLRICGASAKLGQPEVSLGIIPGAGATYRLPRAIGIARAKELIFTGRVIDAAEADTLGLVNRVVPDDAVLSSALALGTEIRRNSRLAVRLAKQTMVAAATLDPEAAMALEATAQAVLFEDDEKNRRMDAFLARRPRGPGPGDST